MKNFEIIESTDNVFSEVIIKNLVTGEYISVLPEIGARLNSAYLKSGESYFSVLNELKSNELNTRDELFNNAKLFPFANRLRKGTYTFDNQRYNFEITYEEENNACHGILFNKEFKVGDKKINEESAEVTLFYQSNGENEGYPFQYKLSVKYNLAINGKVKVDTYIENMSDKSIPVAEGWHPYFSIPGLADEFNLVIPAVKFINVDENKVPNGTSELIEGGNGLEVNLRNKCMDNCFLLKNNGSPANTILYNEEKKYSLNVWQETGIGKYNFIQVYIPPMRNTIAIEPMTSNIDAFNNKDHLIILEPGEKWNASFGFYLANKTNGKNE